MAIFTKGLPDGSIRIDIFISDERHSWTGAEVDSLIKDLETVAAMLKMTINAEDQDEAMRMIRAGKVRGES